MAHWWVRMACAGRLWDCRTGRSPFALEGHVKQILSLDFSPSGVYLATGSDDHTAKVSGGAARRRGGRHWQQCRRVR